MDRAEFLPQVVYRRRRRDGFAGSLYPTISAGNDARDTRSVGASAGDEGERRGGGRQWRISNDGGQQRWTPHPCLISADVDVSSTEQPLSGDTRTSACSNVKRGATWQRCAPSPCIQSTIVMVTSAPVKALYQRCLCGETHGLAAIDAVVCHEARGSPRQHRFGNKGEPRQQDGRFTKRYAWICVSVCLLILSFSLSLCCFLGSHSVYVLCDATVRCLYNVIV